MEFRDMLEVLHYKFIQRAIVASILGGASCGVVGVWVIMMRIPFVGVSMSHAAFAGAVLGLLLNVNPLLLAILFCLVSAALIGPIADRAEFDPNISLSIIFSAVLGIAFLGIGLMKGPRTEALNLIWGNILMLSSRDLLFLSLTSFCIFLFLVLFFKEVQAILFNREIARAVGIPERAIFYLILSLCGINVALNLNTIGGLLIFSLIVNPPSAAYQLTYSLKKMFALSAAFGVSSCLLGLSFSYAFNAPSGAVIIIASSLIFIRYKILSPKRRVVKLEGDS